MSFRKDKQQKILQNLEGLLSELISSEEAYVEGLSLAVEGYLAEFRREEPRVKVPLDLKEDKAPFVFCNIEQIYHWHRDFFLKALIKNRQSPLELGKVFLSCESQFNMYVKYSSNKNISDYIVNEHSEYFNRVRKILGQKMELNSFLITPIQRLPRYKLLLSQIEDRLKKLVEYKKKLSETRKDREIMSEISKWEADRQSMEEACKVMDSVLINFNYFTNLQSIENYSEDLADHGKLIYHEFLTCKYDGKKIRHYVFLFRRMLIFTDKRDTKRKFGTATHNYRFQIPMNKLQLKEMLNKRFMLTANSLNLTVVCSGETEELHKTWVEQIQNQLTIQANLMAELSNPTGCGAKEVLCF